MTILELHLFDRERDDLAQTLVRHVGDLRHPSESDCLWSTTSALLILHRLPVAKEHDTIVDASIPRPCGQRRPQDGAEFGLDLCGGLADEENGDVLHRSEFSEAGKEIAHDGEASACGPLEGVVFFAGS